MLVDQITANGGKGTEVNLRAINEVNHLSAKIFMASNVSLDVSAPRTISTNFITGGGFMKCMPMTCNSTKSFTGKLAMLKIPRWRDRNISVFIFYIDYSYEIPCLSNMGNHEQYNPYCKQFSWSWFFHSMHAKTTSLNGITICK